MSTLLLLLLAGPAWSAPEPAGESGHCFVLIIAGHPGNELYARHYRDRTTRFYNYFARQVHVAAANITLLSGDADFKEGIVSGPATAASIPAALAELRKRVTPEDQFILVLLGHGATSEESCTLMLPGPDLEVSTLATALDRLAARNQVVLNFASNSGDWIARLARAGRVLVSSSSPGQVNDSDFAEFFLQALETGAADDAAKSPPEQPLSVLTAYNWATLHTAQWTVRQRLSSNPDTPGWTVDGKQSAALFQKLYSGPGVSADRRFIPSPASETPDAPVELVNKQDESWFGRRLVSETPALQDRGAADKEGARSALGEKGFQPLLGASAKEIGFLARRTVLGSPQLLPVPPAKEK
jgi:hypothetical protein